MTVRSSFAGFFFHNAQWSSHRPIPPLRALPDAVYKQQKPLPISSRLRVYAQLSKANLTTLIVLSAMSAVAVSPLPATMPVLFSTALGTALCSASANALNQIQEVPFDAQMARTRSRPLVRRAITPLHASAFAAATGIAGPAILWTMVNPATAILGLGNIALYAGAYTWMKRKSVANTWVGSLVGGIPPLMGWTACGGGLLPSAEYPIHLFLPSFMSSVPMDPALANNPLSALSLALLLYCWQFPHFNSLSYIVRGSYAQAGYHMLSVLNPPKNALVSLRHAIFLVPVCSILVPLSGLTTWTYALTTLIPNLICVRAAWRYWRTGGEKNARSVFQHSLWYLPVVLGFMMFHKQGVDWLDWLGQSVGIKRKEIEESTVEESQS